jgi:protein ImuB
VEAGDTARQPFVLQARDPRRGWLVMASNEAARQYRIYPGMPIGEACALLPSLKLFEYEPQEDLQALIELAQEAWQFSPIVGLEPLDPHPWAGHSLHQPQAFFLEADGLTHLFGGLTGLLLRLNAWLCTKGWTARSAAAPSLGAAWALAHYAKGTQLNYCDGEDGQINELRPLFWRLPIESLRLDVKTVHTLHQLGIRDIEALIRLPRAGLAGRFGERLLQRIDAVCYGQAEHYSTLKADLLCSVEIPLEFPTDHRATLEELLRRAMRRLCEQLRRHGQGLLRLSVCLRVEQGPAWWWTLGLYRATSDEEHLTKLLLGQFEQHFDDRSRRMPARVTTVELTATLTAPLVWKQTELFDGEERRLREIVAHSIDMLAARLGRKQVVAPQLQKHPQPELVCQWRPLTGRRVDGNTQTTSRKLPRSSSKPKTEDSTPLIGNLMNPQVDDPMRRPVQLYQPPRPVEMHRCDPNGAPEEFFVDGEVHQVRQAWGPERIESGWWSGAHHRRDYYRLETTNGAWLWLFRELQKNHWYLHGFF